MLFRSAELANAKLVAATVPVISNVTAQPHTSPDQISVRMVEQVTSSVRWEESMRYLLMRFMKPDNAAPGPSSMKRV